MPQKKLCFIDLETTGTTPWKNGIVQIAGIIEIDDEVKEEFSYSLRPFDDQEISDQAIAVTGLTREQINTFEKPTAIKRTFTALLSTYVNRFDKQDKFNLIAYTV